MQRYDPNDYIVPFVICYLIGLAILSGFVR